MKFQRAALSRLFAALPPEVDGAFITSPENIRYFCGFAYQDGYLLLTRSGCTLFTDFRYREAAQAAVGADFTVEMITALRAKQLAECAAAYGARRLAYEDKTLSCATFRYFQNDTPTVEWTPLGDLPLRLRSIKTPDEIDCIRRAQRIAEAALAETLPLLSCDMTELDVAAELEYRMRRHGSEGTAFDTIAISGTATSLPHGEPQNRRLQKGFLTMDFGARVEGYCSDMTRTVYLGHPSKQEREVYETVRTAQEVALSRIALGADCGAIHAAAAKIIDGAGYAGCFGHGLGHGVGLYIHEEPRLSPSGTGTALCVGHVVTVEPGIYLAGQYGVRIEDMVALLEHGAENLTRFPKELCEL